MTRSECDMTNIIVALVQHNTGMIDLLLWYKQDNVPTPSMLTSVSVKQTNTMLTSVSETIKHKG